MNTAMWLLILTGSNNKKENNTKETIEQPKKDIPEHMRSDYNGNIIGGILLASVLITVMFVAKLLHDKDNQRK